MFHSLHDSQECNKHSGSSGVCIYPNLAQCQPAGNSITTTNTNGDLTLAPQGTGKVIVDTGNVLNLADHNDNAIVFTNSNGDLTSSTLLTYNGATGEFIVEDIAISGHIR